MTAQVTVGLDGSDESLAAARWAAAEAALREVPLRLVYVEEWPNTPEIPAPHARTLYERAGTLLDDEAERARKDHPDLEVATEQARGRAADELAAAADAADLLVLGSRGLGVLGFVIGSVSLAVVGTARRPVVLVRAEHPDTAPSARGIVVGVDLRQPSEPLLAFAFEEAARRRAPVRFLSAWTAPASYGFASAMDPGINEELGNGVRVGLEELLAPWRTRCPGVDVTAEAVAGSAAFRMTEASREAELVVVGRRTRRLPVGPHIGHVAHAVIHHSPAPVAVVPQE
ncbi:MULTISPECIES: universal stress protein [Streptomyces]|uniref:universal stress protein n=1 Tax=Streptomyces TaxID=1883 RepID=UPI0010C1DA06|nr:universal stress protein [Streptomyces sp. BPSDS2]